MLQYWFSERREEPESGTAEPQSKEEKFKSDIENMLGEALELLGRDVKEVEAGLLSSNIDFCTFPLIVSFN